MTEVARLLALSLQAHQDAKRARVQHRYTDSRALWQTALDARVDAHALDPEHTDPAWQAEQDKSPRGRDTHAELMQFYAERGLTPHAPTPAPIPKAPEVLSIQEIAAKVQPSNGQDAATSDAFALLLIESGWLTLADLNDAARQRSPFRRLVALAESAKTGEKMAPAQVVETPAA